MLNLQKEGMKKAIITIIVGVKFVSGMFSFLGSFFFLYQDEICRRVRGVERRRSRKQIFIPYGKKLEFDGEEFIFSKEECDILNSELQSFVMKITGAQRILNVSDPIPHMGIALEMGGRVRTYEFKVDTDKGNVSIFIKWLEEPVEAERFQEASKLGIAPICEEILLGFITYKKAEGVKLETLALYTDWLSQPEHYIPLAQQLGEVVAKLELIEYSETLEHNVLVDIKDEEIKIWAIDYEDGKISIGLVSNHPEGNDSVDFGYYGLIRDIYPIYQQAQDWIGRLDIDENIKREMLNTFIYSYKEAKKNYP